MSEIATIKDLTDLARKANEEARKTIEALREASRALGIEPAPLPPGWRQPPKNEIDAARALEATEEWKREADEYSADGSGSINWED